MADALPRAVLFDLDDTILAYDVVTEESWRAVCGHYASPLGVPADALFEAVRRRSAEYWGDPERHRWGRLHLDEARSAIVGQALDALGAASPERVPELSREIAVAYDHRRMEAMYPLPGAVEALRRLRERGLRLALLTNGSGPIQRAKIDRFGLGPLFDCLSIEGEFGAGKPDERVFRHALACLGAAPREAWMVGDDLERDVAGAQRVGITGIWVDTRGAGLPAGGAIRPHRVVRSVVELVLPRHQGREGRA